jgi:hypothetical protein
MEWFCARIFPRHAATTVDSRRASKNVEGLVLHGNLLKKSISFQDLNRDDDLYDTIGVAISLRILHPSFYPRHRIYQQFQVFLLSADRGTTFELCFTTVLPRLFQTA